MIFESQGVRPKRVIKNDFPTFDDAKIFLYENYDVVFYEDDPDNPNCADIFTSSGMILCIEPLERLTPLGIVANI